MTLLLASCAVSSSGVREIISRDIPGPPSYLRPVIVPDPKEGEAALIVAGRERAGRLKANSIIVDTRTQWDQLRKTLKRTR